MSCSAVGCKNRFSNGHRLFRFPKDKKMRFIWECKVSRKDWKPSDASRLCEAHFESTEFEQNRLDGKKKLKWGAVPALFDHRKRVHRRQPPKPRQVPVNVYACIERGFQHDHIYRSINAKPPVAKKSRISVANKVKLDINNVDNDDTDFNTETIIVNLPESVSANKPETVNVNKPKTVNANKPETVSANKAKTVNANKPKTVNANEPEADNANEPETDNETDTDVNKPETVNPAQTDVNACVNCIAKKTLIQSLRKRISDLTANLATEKRHHKQLKKVCNRNNGTFFWSLTRKTSGKIKFDDAAITKALEIRFACGTSGYKLLVNQGFPLPSLRTLQLRMKQNTHVLDGISKRKRGRKPTAAGQKGSCGDANQKSVSETSVLQSDQVPQDSEQERQNPQDAGRKNSSNERREYNLNDDGQQTSSIILGNEGASLSFNGQDAKKSHHSSDQGSLGAIDGNEDQLAGESIERMLSIFLS